jgi:hypothetical protein
MLELEQLPYTETIAASEILLRKTHVSGCNFRIALTISTKLFRRLVQARGLEKTRNFIAYREHAQPNQTPDAKNKAKLGNVVKLSDAINFLYNINEQVFDQQAYRKHNSLIRLYFSPPYNSNLFDAFGFPDGTPAEKPLPFSA